MPSESPNGADAEPGMDATAGGPEADRGEDPTDAPAEDPAGVESLLEDLEDLDGAGSADADRERRETEALLVAAHERGLIRSETRDLRAADAAQAFVGSVIFATSLLVEGGVFDIGTHLFTATVAGVPAFLVANTLFVVLLTYALLEWTGRNREETALLFGRIPVRVLMVLGVSFVVATLLMTVWGRIDWQQPTEALARINVVWTVGSLGAALGDILAEEEPETPAAAVADGVDAHTMARVDGELVEPATLSDSALVVALQTQFEELEATVRTAAERRAVQRLQTEAVGATLDRALGDRIQKYTGRDVAEAFVGSIFFSVPFLVEDGVFEVADYFLSFRVGLFPVFFLVNAAFVLVIIAALVYGTGPQEVEVSHPFLGVVPRRLVGIVLVSFLTAAALMTMWGRVGGWQDPVVALARISVVWTVASFGAALGDILPGESSGDDINDELAELGERFEEPGGDDGEGG